MKTKLIIILLFVSFNFLLAYERDQVSRYAHRYTRLTEGDSLGYDPLNEIWGNVNPFIYYLEGGDNNPDAGYIDESDCSHFVSQCLQAGGIPIYEDGHNDLPYLGAINCKNLHIIANTLFPVTREDWYHTTFKDSFWMEEVLDPFLETNHYPYNTSYNSLEFCSDIYFLRIFFSTVQYSYEDDFTISIPHYPYTVNNYLTDYWTPVLYNYYDNEYLPIVYAGFSFMDYSPHGNYLYGYQANGLKWKAHYEPHPDYHQGDFQIFCNYRTDNINFNNVHEIFYENDYNNTGRTIRYRHAAICKSGSGSTARVSAHNKDRNDENWNYAYCDNDSVYVPLKRNSITFYNVGNSDGDKPNLCAYNNWGANAIITTSDPDSTTNIDYFAAGEPVYIKYAFQNNGGVMIPDRFKVRVELDDPGTLIDSILYDGIFADSIMIQNVAQYFNMPEIDNLTISIHLDAGDSLDYGDDWERTWGEQNWVEDFDGDNVFSKTIYKGTLIQTGDVSGRWTIEGSPYIVPDSIQIPQDSTLIIEPGVQVIFLGGSGGKGSYKFNVYGTLLAEGTADSMIAFTTQDSSWQGIEITSSGNASFTCCEIENAEGVYLYNNSGEVTLDRVTFENCGLYNETKRLDIKHCTFTNSNIQHLSNELYISNSSFDSTGVNCNYLITPPGINPLPKIKITNCSFEDYGGYTVSITGYDRYELCNDTISQCGGGFYIYESGSPKASLISNNTIEGNHCCGIMLYNSYARIYGHNDIQENLIGILALNLSSMRIVGNENFPYSIIKDNKYEEIAFDGDSYPEETYYNKIIDDVYEEGTRDQYLMAFFEFIPVPPFELNVKDNYWGVDYGDHRFFPGDYFDYIPIWDPGTSRSLVSSSPEQLYTEADSLIVIEEYEQAKLVYQNIIELYPESKFAIFSMRNLLPLETVSGQDFVSLKEYYLTDPNCNYDNEKSKLSAYLANYCNIKMENYPEAISFFEDIVEEPDTELDSIYAVIDAGYTYLLMEDKSSYTGKMPELKPKSLEEFEATRDRLLSKLFDIPEQDEEDIIPESNFYLGQNYPNPFSPRINQGSTTISFSLPLYTQKAELKIYNIKGQLVKKLDIYNKSGIGSITWDGLDSYGRKFGSGIYFYKLSADKKEIIKKMVLMR